MGKDKTSTQQITRSAPKDGVKRAPPMYPSDPLIMASNKNMSAKCILN